MAISNGSLREPDDVGVLGHRGPVRVVHDDRVDAAECAPQSGDVLVVMKRVAARPVHQFDVGICQPPSVVVELLAGMKQHIADRRDGDERLHRIGALWQRR
jgi:hypothetical protein